MTGYEIVLMIREFAVDGRSLTLSPDGVRELANEITWQTIESCPVNEAVLLFVSGRGICVGGLRVGSDPEGFCHPFAAFSDCFDAKNRNATHWMPMPQPPAGSP